MIINVASFESDVAKTMFAIHLAARLQTKAPTIFVDCSFNHFALTLLDRVSLPFRATTGIGAGFAGHFTHAVFDIQARRPEDDLKNLAGNCDLLIIPTTPDALSLESIGTMLLNLRVQLRTEPPNGTQQHAQPSDTDYFQATAYIKRETIHGPKVEMLRQTPPMEFSNLVERVFADWIQNKQ